MKELTPLDNQYGLRILCTRMYPDKVLLQQFLAVHIYLLLYLPHIALSPHTLRLLFGISIVSKLVALPIFCARIILVAIFPASGAFSVKLL